jgi:hypothetical protein
MERYFDALVLRASRAVESHSRNLQEFVSRFWHKKPQVTNVRVLGRESGAAALANHVLGRLRRTRTGARLW